LKNNEFVAMAELKIYAWGKNKILSNMPLLPF